MAVSTSLLNSTLLTAWQRDSVRAQFSARDPLFEKLKFEPGLGDPAYNIDLNLSTGASHTAAVAEDNASQVSTLRFRPTYTRDFAGLKVSHLDTLAAQTDGSMVRLAEQQYTNAMRSLVLRCIQGMYGDQTASLGAIAAPSGSTVTLTGRNAILSARRLTGSKVVFAEASATGALRDSGDTLTISKVDTNTGVVTFTTAVSGIADLAAGDHMIVQGDAANGGATRGYVGLQKWIETTPGDLYGVTRANYSRELVAGVLSDQSAFTGGKLAALKEGLVDVFDKSDFISPHKVVIMRASDFNQISNELSSIQHHYVVTGSKTMAGHACITVAMGGATADIYSSVHCPEGQVFVVDPDPSAIQMHYLKDEAAHNKASSVFGLKDDGMLKGPMGSVEGKGNPGGVPSLHNQPFAPMMYGAGTFWDRVNGDEYKGLIFGYTQMSMYVPSAHGRIILP